MKVKSKGTARLLWFGCFILCNGLYYFYLGKPGKGVLWLCTLGLLGIGQIIDLFSIGQMVDTYNLQQQMKQITQTTMATAAATTAMSNVQMQEMNNKKEQTTNAVEQTNQQN